MRLPIFACLGWMVLLGSFSFAQDRCQARCPDGSMSEGFACASNYVPACLRRAPSTAAAPAGPTPQQQMGLALGQAAMPIVQQAVHNLFYGTPTAQPPPDPAQQQRELAAQQLNNSGIFLLKQKNYAGAINEFQQALAITPNNANITHNLARAKQQLKDAGVAAQTSGALGLFLGNVPADAGQFDFDRGATPNGSALSFFNLNTGVVDLRGTTRTAPESLKDQIEGIFANNALTSASPNSQVVLPQVKDIELLFDAASPASQRSNVVLPQAKDMELLFDAGPPASPRTNVVLPQDKDMELLFDAGPPASPRTNVILPQDKDMELLFPSSTPVAKPAPASSSGQPHN